MCLHWRNWVRFFHVQYKKRRVLLAERKRLVTHRVTCLLHFKCECTSFVCARECVCVCVMSCAQKGMCSGAFHYCSQRLFCRWNLLLCGNAHARGHCAIFLLRLWDLRTISPHDMEISSLHIFISLWRYPTFFLLGVVFAWFTISHFLICVTLSWGTLPCRGGRRQYLRSLSTKLFWISENACYGLLLLSWLHV